MANTTTILFETSNEAIAEFFTAEIARPVEHIDTAHLLSGCVMSILCGGRNAKALESSTLCA